jgi:hypothetical protein
MYGQPNDNPIEIAPIVGVNGPETIFGGYGNSHFSFVEGQGYHVTTAIPGFGQDDGLSNGLSEHDFLGY